MGHLVYLSGAPGIGKSTLARALSQREGISFIDRDLLYSGIFEDSQEGFFGPRNGPITKVLWEIGRNNAARGASMILESPMTGLINGRPSSFVDETLVDAADRNYVFSLVYCTAPEEFLHKNLLRRSQEEPGRDSGHLADFQAHCSKFLGGPGPVGYDHLVIKTNDPLDENLERIVRYMHRTSS